jgi:opacity protein-like surface antigen
MRPFFVFRQHAWFSKNIIGQRFGRNPFRPAFRGEKQKTTRKTMTTKTTSLLAACAALLAGAALNAQDDSLALPKNNGHDYTFTVGPTLLNAKIDASYGDSSNLAGITAAFGWRINRHNKLQWDIGFQYRADLLNAADGDTLVMPVLFSYNFCVPFGERDRFEFRVAPTIGFTYLYGYSDYYDDDDSDTALTYGAGLGFTIHATSRVFVDFLYRYAQTSDFKSAKLAAVGLPDEFKFKASSFTIAIGFKF